MSHRARPALAKTCRSISGRRERKETPTHRQRPSKEGAVFCLAPKHAGGDDDDDDDASAAALARRAARGPLGSFAVGDGRRSAASDRGREPDRVRLHSLCLSPVFVVAGFESTRLHVINVMALPASFAPLVPNPQRRFCSAPRASERAGAKLSTPRHH